MNDGDLTVYAVHEPENYDEPVFLFATQELADEFARRRGDERVTSEPVLGADFLATVPGDRKAVSS